MWGETVTVEYADGTVAEVQNVLVQQTDLTDLTVLDVQTRFINQARYKGDTSTLTLCWPKTNDGDDLNDAHVTVRGNRYRVYSDPVPFDMVNCPTMWNRTVTVIRSIFRYDVQLIATTSVQDQYGVWVQSFTERTVKANLLRLAESNSYDASKRENEHLVMVEIPQEVYGNEPYVGYHGMRYLVTETAYSNDTVVMTCIAPNVAERNV